MKQANSAYCDIVPVDFCLQHKIFNIQDCYSEYASSFNNRLHFHNFYELSVIYEGSSHFLVNGSSFYMEKRSLQLIRPSDYHMQLTAQNESFRYYNLTFSDELLSPLLLQELENNRNPLCSFAREDEWRDIRKLIAKIYTEFTQSPDDALSQIFIRSGVEMLCTFLLRNQADAKSSCPDIPQEPLRKAIAYIQKNYRLPVTLADAASAAGLSPSYFSSVFHAAIGIPFSRYLTDYRLQAAERYLRSSDLSVKQIAFVCGFSSYPYFVTGFRERFGVSPGLYRKQKRQKQ